MRRCDLAIIIHPKSKDIQVRETNDMKCRYCLLSKINGPRLSRMLMQSCGRLGRQITYAAKGHYISVQCVFKRSTLSEMHNRDLATIHWGSVAWSSNAAPLFVRTHSYILLTGTSALDGYLKWMSLNSRLPSILSGLAPSSELWSIRDGCWHGYKRGSMGYIYTRTAI